MHKSYQFFISHPIQYFSPLFFKMSTYTRIEVNYYSDHSLHKRVVDDLGELPEWDTPLLEGYNYFFLKNYAFKPKINKFWNLVNLSVVSKVAKSDFDYIVVHGWNSFSNYLVLITAFFFKKKVLLKAESPLKQELIKSNKSLKQKIKIWFLRNFTFKLVHQFLYIGDQNFQFYKWLGVSDEKLIFSPYCVNNKQFRTLANSLPEKKILKNKLGITKSGIVFGFVGKLIEKKDPLSLLNAFIQGDNDDNALVFVGSGILESKINEIVESNNANNVITLGYKNQLELPEIYASFDVFVLPSGVGETWGLVVNEAMLFGLPVIVSDLVGCSDDLVKDNGYTFKFNSVPELIKAMNNIEEDLKSNKKLGKNSLQLIDKYSYDTIIKELSNAHD